MMKKFSIMLLVSVFSVFLVVGSAWGTPILTLNDDGGLVEEIIIDEGAGDLFSGAGTVTYIGTIGAWSINVTTGVTKPALGDANYSQLHLDSINISGGGPGTLTITFWESGFNNSGIVSLATAVGGTTNGSVTVDTFVNGTIVDGTLVNGTLLSSSGVLDSFAFETIEQGTIENLAGIEFSLGVVATITHTGRNQTTSFDAHVSPVPEPATMMLFGSGLIGFAFIGRKKFFNRG